MELDNSREVHHEEDYRIIVVTYADGSLLKRYYYTRKHCCF